jgi:hypothetical protein
MVVAHCFLEPGDEGVIGMSEAHQWLLSNGAIVQIFQTILGAPYD